jgi:large repetitive protein
VGLKRLLFLVVLAAAISLGLASSAPAGNFDEERMGCSGEDPATCPPGTVGQAYSLTIYLNPTPGNPPGDRGQDFGCATFHVTSGTFPPGLSISDEGYISGTPTQAGTYDFFLTVKYDKPGCDKPQSDDRFIIQINQGLAKLTLGPESTSPGTSGVPYSLQMTASVADPKTWTINSGALPPGLAIDAGTGLITGTPTTAGQYTFEVKAKMNSDARSDTKVLGIVIRDPVSIVGGDPFTSARRAPAAFGAPFEAMLTASGGSGTYTWSLSAGTLPRGLLFADGAFSGMPREEGSFAFTATATDSEGRVASYPGRIVVAPKLTIATSLIPPVRVGKFFQRKLTTVGGVKPASWRLVRGPLPRGVFFDRFAGVLYGYPSRPGVARAIFEAKDAFGVIARKTLRIVVLPAPEPKTTTG